MNWKYQEKTEPMERKQNDEAIVEDISSLAFPLQMKFGKAPKQSHKKAGKWPNNGQNWSKTDWKPMA